MEARMGHQMIVPVTSCAVTVRYGGRRFNRLVRLVRAQSKSRRMVIFIFVGMPKAVLRAAARRLASDFGSALYRVELSAIISKYIGETEKRLAVLFETAQRAGAVVLFDEAEALFGRRSGIKDAHDRYANIEVDYLLQRLEAFRGVAVLAAQSPATAPLKSRK